MTSAPIEPALHPSLSPCRRWLDRWFGIDVRSLAALRIGLGLLLLVGIFGRCADLAAHYSDAGVLSRTARIALDRQGEWTAPPYWLSLNMLSGAAWWQGVLMGAAAVAAVGVTIGYRTRLCLAVSWILLIGLQARNPLVLQGGDDLLRCMLLWSLFLPLGAAWSVDRARSGTSGGKRALSVASAAILLQLCVMYWFTALLKTDPVWRSEFSAVYYALSTDHFSTPFGLWLLKFPAVLQFLTVATWILEWAGPFLLFCPVRTGRIRVAIVASFIGLHLGLAATLEIGMFSYNSMVYWLVFLPGGFWDFAARRVPRFARSTASALAGPFAALGSRLAAKSPQGPATAPSLGLGLAGNALAAVLLWYVMALNVARADCSIDSNLPNGPVRWIGKAAQLDQFWCMFAPRPYPFGGWLVLKGTLYNGTEVNLFDPGRGVPDTKPELVSSTYPNQRWRKCLLNMIERNCPQHRENISHFLRQRWDATHSGDERVAFVDLVNMAEATRPPGSAHAAEPVESKTLLRWDYRLSGRSLGKKSSYRFAGVDGQQCPQELFGRSLGN